MCNGLVVLDSIIKYSKHCFEYGSKQKIEDIVSLAHNVSFWAQKLTHSVSFWALKLTHYDGFWAQKTLKVANFCSN